MPKLELPQTLSETQKAGIRAVHSELDRFYKALLQTGEILFGIDETIQALQLPVPSPIGGDYHVDFAQALVMVSHLQDCIQSQHYAVLFPSLARAVDADMIRAAIRQAEKRQPAEVMPCGNDCLAQEVAA